MLLNWTSVFYVKIYMGMYFLGLSKGVFSQTSKMDRFEKFIEFLAGELCRPIMKQYLKNCIKFAT